MPAATSHSTRIDFLDWLKTMGTASSNIEGDADNVCQISTASREATPMSSVAPTRPQRLPPVQSRETVQCQAARVTCWRLIDDSTDLYESVENGPVDFSKQLSLSSHNTSDSGTDLLSGFTKPSLVDVPSVLGKRTASVEPGAVTKRLKATPRAIEIASQLSPSDGDSEQYLNQQSESESEFTDGKGDWDNDNPWSQISSATTNFDSLDANMEPHHHDKANLHLGSCLYQDSDHEDEGYWSKVVTPTTGQRVLTDEEKEEELAKTIRYLHQTNIMVSRQSLSTQHITRRSAEEDALLEHARLCMIKEQEAGAARSRLLREQALERRRLREQSESGIILDQAKIFTETDRSETADWDPPSDSEKLTTTTLDENDDDELDKLLDIAKEHIVENTRPTPSTLHYLEGRALPKYVQQGEVRDETDQKRAQEAVPYEGPKLPESRLSSRG